MNEKLRQVAALQKLRFALAFLFIVIALLASTVAAHPLGNFTINHFTRIEVSSSQIRLHYVIDMAEIAAFQEMQAMDADGDGAASEEELTAYLERQSAKLAEGLRLAVDDKSLPLQLTGKSIARPAGAGGLATLRIELDFVAAAETTGAHRVRVENRNYDERIGWREMAAGSKGVSIFDSNVYGNGLSDELKAYPEDLLAAPLNERVAEFSFTSGNIPEGARALLTRDGKTVSSSRDRFAELIAVEELTPGIAMLGLLIAAVLGAVHAMSPGHGKTVVGAYLIGARGTARHAAYLGLTVTVTHTLGVFALGLITLFASNYVLPEKLFPVLSLISGAIVLTLGLTMFVKRLRVALGKSAHSHRHHSHDHHHAPDHALTHSHGGREHTHLPPGADGSQITWRSIIALGVSGGLLPCPSALVVMLSAISLNRVGYGLVLVIAFSLGLAATLTGVGLLFVYAGRLMKQPRSGRLLKVIPALSAFVIAAVGFVICYEALAEAGFDVLSRLAALKERLFGSMVMESLPSTISVLALGLVAGLRHAMDADHVAAVSTIVSERKSLLSSSLIGGLWGLGHTAALLVAGIIVLVLRIEISPRVEMALEFCVALMLIGLGANALRKLKSGWKLHLHTHTHGHHTHVHPHLHDGSPEPAEHTHHGFKLEARPIIIGMVHGLAGSGALMLLVLSTISSPAVGIIFIVIFGIGSIGGMMLMSALISLPIRLTADRFKRANLAVRVAAGAFSLAFGLFMVYQIGFVDRLFG
ncbi:MAG: hypothetical protein AB1631_17670 [Acidobacteriota bacterium]